MKVNSFIPLFYLSSFSIPLQKGGSRPGVGRLPLFPQGMQWLLLGEELSPLGD